jgi:hypothetical protein
LEKVPFTQKSTATVYALGWLSVAGGAAVSDAVQ